MLDWRKLLRRLGVALNLRDPPNVPPYGWSYFDHLVAVYVTLNKSDPRADLVIKKSRERPDDLTWGDIFLVENTIFSIQSPEVVERSAWILRERFREIASSSIYNKYINSNFPKETDTPANLSLLRADLTRVLDFLHWNYSLIPMRERIRTSLTVKCIWLVAFYTGLLAGFLLFCSRYSADFLAMLACVIYWGIIGGFVSSQRRMQSIPSDGDPLVSVFGLDNAGYYLWLSPLLGAIFAVIPALMFIAGILKGAVFPEFVGSSAGTQGLPFFDFRTILPKSAEEYGKLFVWAFLAGFAERLVPDSLDRLASKLDPRQQSEEPNTLVDQPTMRTTPTKEPDPAAIPEPMPEITAETLQDVMHTGEVQKEPDKSSKSEQQEK